jgi:hypothetical protein
MSAGLEPEDTPYGRYIMIDGRYYVDGDGLLMQQFPEYRAERGSGADTNPGWFELQ